MTYLLFDVLAIVSWPDANERAGLMCFFKVNCGFTSQNQTFVPLDAFGIILFFPAFVVLREPTAGVRARSR